MCGIFAVSGEPNNAGELVLQGLKNLEYRGYDSWGVASRSTTQMPLITKSKGKISAANNSFPPANEALGHTRWATHGQVTTANAHPHQFGSITLVHNGVCENYLELKKQYAASIDLKSETDTEILAVMLDVFFRETGDPLQSLQKLSQQLTGRFAVAVMFEGHAGIWTVRRGSPLIVGRAENQTFVASDIPAFLSITNQVNYLDDDEAVQVVKNQANFFDLISAKPITKRLITVPWQVQESQKGDFPHFMIKEIFEQKSTLSQVITIDESLFSRAAELMQAAKGTYFVACGTAHKTIMAAEYFFAKISQRKINVVMGSEMLAFQDFIHPQTVMVAVSQSGETADVLKPVEAAIAAGAKVIAITNVESSSLARLATITLPLQTGPERAVASTKATTAMLADLLLLAYADAGQFNQGREILRSTAAAINDWLNPRYEEYIKTLAQELQHHATLSIIGRHTLFPIALEAAIKIQEVAYIHAHGYAAGELKHGPIALIESGYPCIVLGDDEATLANAIEVKSRGGIVVGIASENREIFDFWLKVPDCGAGQPIASIIPVQMLAYHLGLLLGHDPDMPRNLAKSVTVT